jgi:hypothetical protein
MIATAAKVANALAKTANVAVMVVAVKKVPANVTVAVASSLVARSRVTFKEFWPQYLALHTKFGTRFFHVLGLVTAYSVVFSALVHWQLWYIAAAPMFGYGLAFSGHFWVEHNMPASFKHPLLSFLADHRMAYLTLRGRL